MLRAVRTGRSVEGNHVVPAQRSVRVGLGPEVWELVVNQVRVHSWLSSSTHDGVEGHVLPKVGHPAACVRALDHVTEDHLLRVPFLSLRIGEVHGPKGKRFRPAVLYVGLPRGVLDEIASRRGLGEQVSPRRVFWEQVGEVGVDVSHDPGIIVCLEVLEEAVPAMVQLCVEFPVPQDPLSERVDNGPRPILEPQRRNRYSIFPRELHGVRHHVRAAFQPNHRSSTRRPSWQGPHAAEPLRVVSDDLQETRSPENTELERQLTRCFSGDREACVRFRREIEDRVQGSFEVKRSETRCDEVGDGRVRRVPVSA
mmetsp:Transcript_12962/g.24797  ORF Transcript_12962/g.24797 Transcript_12962/m.24797 type:complete len:311 (-) Transcript_12962:649-1581(-)